MEKLRVIYSKSKEAVYMSHLDTLKIIEQALSRADMPVEFSNGFNPRPEINFAHPLSVGIESVGEIFEVLLKEKVESPYFIKEMNKVLPSGITILAADYVSLEEKSLMSRVYASTYIISFIYPDELFDGKSKKEIEDIKKYYINKMNEYLSQRNILVLKKSKNRMERIDVKPFIMDFLFNIDQTLEISLSTGSKNNLKPEFLLNGFNEFADSNLEFEIKRIRILYN